MIRKKQFWTEGAGSFVLAIAAALFIRWALMEAYVIPSGSMLPTLLVNDHIFVNKINYGVRLPFTEKWLFRMSEPQRGEIIVFKYPEDKSLYYIKRVVGLPGDRVFYENGNLYINEKLIEKSIPQLRRDDFQWLRDEDFPGRDGGLANYVHWEEELEKKNHSILLKKGERTNMAFGPYTVPADHLFVMGDNRDNSLDSRLWDPKASRAGGQVLFRRKSGIGSIKIPAGTLIRTVAEPAQKFRTLEDVEASGQETLVAVKAVEPGLSGNLPVNSLQILETPVEGADFEVTNPQALTGGEDKRFVPREFIVGRSMFVWLSCEEKLPVLTFLCNPVTIRWTRFFHSVQ